MFKFFCAHYFLIYTMCLLSCVSVQGQSIPWYALNGSDPVQTVHLNPAYQFREDMKSSVHIASVGIDYYNNFGYFKDRSFLELPFNISAITIPEIQYDKNGINTAQGLERDAKGFEMKLHSDNFSKMYFSTNVSITGPGYIAKTSGEWSWGIISGAKIHGDLNNRSSRISDEQHKIYRESNLVNMLLWNGLGYSYFYVGGHLARSIDLKQNDKLRIGLNLKYLGGLNYTLLENEEYVESFNFGNNDDLVLSNLSVKYAFTHGSKKDFKDPVKGSGAGADLGMSYSKNFTNRPVKNINFGFSINNLGFIKFNESMRTGRLEINQPTGIRFNDLDSTISLDQFVDSVQTLLSSGTLNSYSESKGATVLTPTDINAMMSVHFSRFANLHLLYSMPVSRFRQEGIMVGFMPELALGKVNVMVPFSFSKWTGFRVGAGINLDFLTFGTDDLSSFFKKDQLEDGSVYFGLNIKTFRKEKKLSDAK